MLDTIYKRISSLNPLFVITVLVPTIVATIYYGFIASNVYVAESQFIIHSPEKPALSGLSLLFKGGALGGDGDATSSVMAYARSRDALKALNADGRLQAGFSSSRVDMFDRFNGFGVDQSFEALYRYFQHKVTIAHDTNSNVTVLTVRAYNAREAHDVNENLLVLGEALVNKLNERAQQDLVRLAQREVDDAERRDRDAAIALSAYRTTHGLVDPEKQAAVNVQLISKLQDELIATRTQLQELRKFTPENAQVKVLAERASSIEQQIQGETEKVAGRGASLMGVDAGYQRLLLETEFADKELALAMGSLEEARNDARRKQVYLERIVQPNEPDKAVEPHRIRNIFATFMLGMVAWGVLSMLLAGLLEHQE